MKVDKTGYVHALLGTPPAEEWFDAVTADAEHSVVSSRILQTELTRVLRREALPVADRDAILDHVGTILITEGILSVAESIGDHLKTLDAVHLASALSCGTQTVVVTHDQNLRAVAVAQGFRVHDPLDVPGPTPT